LYQLVGYDVVVIREQVRLMLQASGTGHFDSQKLMCIFLDVSVLFVCMILAVTVQYMLREYMKKTIDNDKVKKIKLKKEKTSTIR